MVVHRIFGSITTDSQLLTNLLSGEAFEKCFLLFGCMKGQLGQMHVSLFGLVFGHYGYSVITEITDR